MRCYSSHFCVRKFRLHSTQSWWARGGVRVLRHCYNLFWGDCFLNSFSTQYIGLIRRPCIECRWTFSCHTSLFFLVRLRPEIYDTTHMWGDGNLHMRGPYKLSGFQDHDLWWDFSMQVVLTPKFSCLFHFQICIWRKTTFETSWKTYTLKGPDWALIHFNFIAIAKHFRAGSL